MFESSWNSVRNFSVPQWLKDAKFGIYTHWGVYSVPACGPNATWYAYNMYREGSGQYNYHKLKYGDPSKFGYKDFIPYFKAERFDADEWAELFKQSGARFAGPVGEHHEGFSMWDTRFNRWNSKNMGPCRDIVGELAGAVRKQGLKYMIAMHHAENWWFYPHWKKQYDVSDPKYSDFYGEHHDMQWQGLDQQVDPNPYILNHHEFWPKQTKPSKAFLDTWLNKLKELVDTYSPDIVWFDFALKWIQEHYKLDFVSYYYNHLQRAGKEGAITYKWHDLSPGAGVEDIEQGKRSDLAYNFWVTDTTVDDGEAWGYIHNNTYKTPTTLIHYLIDNVSKNGALLLSLGPRADGVIPDEVKHILREMGKWLKMNGEAIYGTTPWMHPEEGPTRLTRSGAFSEQEKQQFTSRDYRYTVKDQYLYAICLGKPGREAMLELPGKYLYPSEVSTVKMLGNDGDLPWSIDGDRMKIGLPDVMPCDHAVVLRIERKHPFE